MGLSLTREGLRFLLLLGIVGFAAFNTKNNVLYLMLSFGIATVLVDFVAGWLSLRRLSVARAELSDAYVGLSAYETVELANGGGVLDACGLTVEGGAATVPFLRRDKNASCRVERLYRRRGVYEGEPVAVSTRFPFGFFGFARKLPAPREHIVYPRIRAIDHKLLIGHRGGRGSAAQRRGQGDDLFRLREYTPGDHMHHVHWKTSAKLGKLMVRELAEAEKERLTVGFVPRISEARDPAEFEILVSAAASLVSQLVRSGARFLFIAGELELSPENRREQERSILTYLAKVGACDELAPEFLTRLGSAVGRGDTVILVSFEETAPRRADVRVLEPETLFAHA